MGQQHIVLNEVTVDAPVHIPSSQQWPGSISILDSLNLESGNSYQLAEHLNSLPGVLMQQGTLSTNRITIRGIGSRTPYNSNRIKAYWGAIPLTDGDGVTAIEDIGFNDISSLTVVKGPSSALYGAGLGGVILINPWTSIEMQEYLKVQSEVGSYGTYSNQLTTALKSDKGSSWITANQLHSNGYRENSLYKRYNLTLKGKYQFGQHYWHYLYNYRYLHGQIPSSLDSIDFNNNPRKAADSWAAIEGYEKSKRHLFNAGVHLSVNSQLSNSIDIFGTISDLDELRPFNRLGDNKNALGLREKLSYQGTNLRVEAGLEALLEHNHVKLYGVKENNLGHLLSSTKLQRSYINLFGLAEYKLHSKLLIQAAFNLNNTWFNSKQQSSESESFNHQYPLTLSPHLGINYQLSDVSIFFASAGHGFSTPSVEEAQLPDGRFNPSIKPEEGYQVDLGYRYIASDNQSKLEASAYWMRMNNLLVTKRESEDIFYGANAGKTSHYGLEISGSQTVHISHSALLILNATFDHSINKFLEFVDDGTDYSNKHLPGIPDYNLYLAATANIRELSIHFNYRAQGSQYLNDSNLNSYNSFSVLNTKMSHSFQLNRFRFQLYLGANNLLDAHYASMVLVNAPSFGNNAPRYYYPAMPFNAYIGLRLSI
ncbi:TonB-dependent receptor [Carboxylicivirga mesophila]|uniref:TonB-dependent receptor n=1 Tax=Carboxylicivirga mesophila TaxID=1166478 RepID=A0ABS5KF04_9BACT|nr:TonB-dependent receptor [Carboxylicivirga mesophila]MBS2213639.1 TonB-dependent receptor [Carboxylicivirga mesophila]